MVFYTIGYGGRTPDQFVALLTTYGIRSLVDVRLRPDRAAMGAYMQARDPGRGIQGLLARGEITYRSFIELGNVFLDYPDWRERYRQLWEHAGNLLLEGLLDQVQHLPQPVCLMCAERRVADCHRLYLAEYLVQQGWEVKHIE